MSPTTPTLADRVESAAGASRELDAEIWLACVPGATREQWSYRHIATGRLCHVDETRQLQADGRRKWVIVPSYTASIDAALTLVPDGWIWDVISTGTAWVMLDDVQETARAATPALALTAAALR